MFENKLKLNPEKNEFIVFSSSVRYKWLKDFLGNCLSPTNFVCNLDVLFDSKFTFTNQVNSVVLTYVICIISFLSFDVSVMVANALVSSCLNYCNFLFRSLSSKNITRLQNIQNCLTCFVSGAFKIYPYYSNH